METLKKVELLNHLFAAYTHLLPKNARMDTVHLSQKLRGQIKPETQTILTEEKFGLVIHDHFLINVIRFDPVYKIRLHESEVLQRYRNEPFNAINFSFEEGEILSKIFEGRAGLRSLENLIHYDYKPISINQARFLILNWLSIMEEQPQKNHTAERYSDGYRALAKLVLQAY